MLQELCKCYSDMEDRLEKDAELCFLKQRLQEKDAAFHALLSQLPEQQRTVITDYIGICAEIDQRIVEISCFLP